MKKTGIVILLCLLMSNALAYMPYYRHDSKSRAMSVQPRTTVVPRSRYRAIRYQRPQQPIINLNRSVPSAVNSLSIQGDVTVRIVRGSANRLQLQQLYPDLSTKVSGNRLTIYNPKSGAGAQSIRPVVKLTCGQLNQLTIAGNCCVTADNLNTDCGLSIQHCGCGSVCLNGPVRLCSIISTGSAQITIRSVASPRLDIMATRNSRLCLSGSSGLLSVRTFEGAVVDARLVCASNALVQAADSSMVTVSTAGNLHAFASGCSNIYYYRTPCNLFPRSEASGTILQMGGY